MESRIRRAIATSRIAYGGAVAGLAVAYLVMGTSRLAGVHANATGIWPPAGIALAALLLFGRRLWPGAFFGALIGSLATGLSPLSAGGIAVGDICEVLLGVHLVQRWCAGRNAFARANDTLRFAMCSAASTALGASIGTAALLVGGSASWPEVTATWTTWWLGNLGGTLIVGPPLVLWMGNGRGSSTPRAGGLEILAMTVVTVLSCVLVFGGWLAPFDTPIGGAVVSAVILWTAYSLGAREVATMNLFLSGIAAWGARHAAGPFGEPSSQGSLLALQLFFVVGAATTLTLAAALAEVRANAAVLRRFRAALDHTADAIVLIEARSGRFLDGNAATYAGLGYSREEFSALGVGDIEVELPPGFKWKDHVAVVHGRGPVTFSGRHRRKDGTTFPVEVNIRHFADGSDEYMISVVRNVSDRQRAARELERARDELERQVTERTADLRRAVARLEREAAEREAAEAHVARTNALLQRVLDTSPDWIFVKDRASRYLFVNEAFARSHGRTVADMIGRPDTDFLPHERSVGAHAHGISIHKDDDVALAGVPVHNLSDQATLADGSIRYFDTIKLPLLDREERVYGVLAYARDVTERKTSEEALQRSYEKLEQQVEQRTAELRQSEARFRAMVEASPDCIFINFGNQIHYINDAGVRLLGGTSPADIVGRSPLQFVHPDYHGLVKERIGKVLASEGVPVLEESYVRLDGVIVDVEVVAFPWNDRGAGGVCVVARDIAERKRAERERTRVLEDLRRHEDELQQLSRRLLEVQERERQHLARELHDEIGQSLTALKIALAIGEQAAAASDDRGSIVKAFGDAAAIADHLLDRAHAISLDLRPPLLDDFGLEAALRSHVGTLKERSAMPVDLVIDLGTLKPSPEVALASYRIVQEALTNVMRHAEAEHVTVAVRQGSDGLHLTVSDDGHGFDSAQVGGRVGMNAMRERAELLGGWCSVASQPGTGTTVHAVFPEAGPDHDGEMRRGAAANGSTS